MKVIIKQIILTLLCGILYSSVSVASWQQHEWKLHIPDPETYWKDSGFGKMPLTKKLCGENCDKGLKEIFKSFDKSGDTDHIEDELRYISLWMDKELNYPQPVMWEQENHNRNDLSDKKSYEKWLKKGAPKGKLSLPSKQLYALIKTRLINPDFSAAPIDFFAGEYDAATGIIEIGLLPFMYGKQEDYSDPSDEFFMSRDNNNQTLAHELFHAVQRNYRKSYFSSPDWIIEGLAEAVGYDWGYYNYKKDFSANRIPKYDTPLAKPYDEYERGHFFYKLGLDLDGSMRYAAPIFKKVAKKDGIGWLDNYLRDTKLSSLAEYYPKFILSLANTKEFYTEKAYPSLEITVPSKQKNKVKYKILKVASTYDEMKVSFGTNNWNNMEDKERVYLISVSILKAQRIKDLSLIVNSKIHKGKEKDLSLVYAQEGEIKKSFIVNVTNVSSNAAKTKKQKFTLQLKAEPASFMLPKCMTMSSKSSFKLKGIDFSALENIELKVSAGKLNGLQYTAPKSAQIVKVTLSLPTISGRSKTIELGEIDVQGDSQGKEGGSFGTIVGDYKINNGTVQILGIPNMMANDNDMAQGVASMINARFSGFTHPNAVVKNHSAEDMKQLKVNVIATGSGAFTMGCESGLSFKSKVLGNPLLIKFTKVPDSNNKKWKSIKKTVSKSENTTVKPIYLLGKGTTVMGGLGKRAVTMRLMVYKDYIIGQMDVSIMPQMNIKIRSKIEMWKR